MNLDQHVDGEVPKILGIITCTRAVFRKRWENALLIGVPLIGSIAALTRLLLGQATWIDFSAFLIFYVFVGLGVALGLHRYFSHKSFSAHPALASVLAAAGTMAFQGSIVRWVADHRRHHAYTDVEGDVHSPAIDPWGVQREGLKGFWYAHVGWMFDGTVTDVSIYGRGLFDDPIISFFSRTHGFWLVLSVLLPALYGFALGGVDAILGAVLFGACLRTTVLHHVVWSVNSFGHSLGRRTFDDGNLSTNNWVLALLTFGDGWHNNHHRYPRSYRHGLDIGEIDINGVIIDFLERVGLAWNVVRIPRDRLVHDLSVAKRNGA